MRFGLVVSQDFLEFPELLRRVRLAESLGFDSAWVGDHFKPNVLGPRSAVGCYLEGWTVLAGLGALTNRIRLGVLVSGVTHRHPSVLAAQAVTVDHLSGGRLNLGVGAAWSEVEHRELGIPFPARPERTDRLEEAIQVMRLLMTEDDVSFQGRYYRLSRATYRPRPVQRPHPPIWVGASGEQRTIPVAARQADVWHAFGSLADLRRKSAVLDRHARSAGRNSAAIVRATDLGLSDSLDRTRERVETLRSSGFTYQLVDWPAGGPAQLEAFASAVLTQLRSG